MKAEDSYTINLIQRSDRIYLRLIDQIERLERSARWNEALRWIEFATRYASLVPCGRFADGRLENVALRIGGQLTEIPLSQSDYSIPEFPSPTDQRSLIHIVNEVAPVGGHARFLANWMQYDPSSVHSVLLLRQSAHPTPSWIEEAAHQTGGKLACLPLKLSPLQRAAVVRKCTRKCDLVVYHVATPDVTPILAYAYREAPPIAFLDHPDHLFWIGSSVADVLLEFRNFGIRVARERRETTSTSLLPIPIPTPQQSISQRDARERFSLAESQVMLLSIGSEVKYRPVGDRNFFATAMKVLDANPQAVLYVVGVPPNSNLNYLQEVTHSRLHLAGIQLDITPYLQAADLYLEGFPMGSGSAVLNAASYGVYPVFPYDAPEWIRMEDVRGVQGLATVSSSEDEYIELISSLINDPTLRQQRGTAIQTQVLQHHTGEGWLQYLSALYDQVADLKHEFRELSHSSSMTEQVDLDLAVFFESLIGRRDTLLRFAWEVRDQLAGRDALRLAQIAISTGDTPLLSLTGLRSWLGLVRDRYRSLSKPA